jgi:hypothetical protein
MEEKNKIHINKNNNTALRFCASLFNGDGRQRLCLFDQRDIVITTVLQKRVEAGLGSMLQ